MATDASTDGQFLPEIHRYCDRFCERCPLSSTCAFYATTHPLRSQMLAPLEFRDIEEVCADYPELLIAQLIGLEQLARRLGSRAWVRRRLKLKPPTAFPLLERSGVASRRLKRFEAQAIQALERWLARVEATYETLGQVTVDSRRIFMSHEAMLTLGWHRAIFPGRLRRALEALWLERREPSAADRSGLRHEAVGFGMSADQSLQELRASLETLSELYPELRGDGETTIEEMMKLRRTLTTLLPEILRLRRYPHWWVSWAAAEERERVAVG